MANVLQQRHLQLLQVWGKFCFELYRQPIWEAHVLPWRADVGNREVHGRGRPNDQVWHGLRPHAPTWHNFPATNDGPTDNQLRTTHGLAHFSLSPILTDAFL